MAAVDWYLLVHQLPPRPLYLRAKIRQRLAAVGAVALKNSVYVLPRRADCLEDFQWIAEEAAAGGGEAWVVEARFLAGSDGPALRRRFNAERDALYRTLGDEAARALRRRPVGADALTRLRARFDEIRAIDFFGAPGAKEVRVVLRKLERKGAGPPTRRRAGRAQPPTGRTWVTRRGVKIDRIASAWLVRRFVDPGARFRFLDPERGVLAAAEVGFDMPGGAFTHEDGRCTFETLLRSLRVRDAALRRIAEVVHDLDLKDGRFGRPETAGVGQLVAGIVAAHPDDEVRLERGMALFDDLYASLGGART